MFPNIPITFLNILAFSKYPPDDYGKAYAYISIRLASYKVYRKFEKQGIHPLFCIKKYYSITQYYDC